jgi:hypothetical protein
MAPVIESHRGTPPDRWDECVAALGAGIFHSAAWARYQAVIHGSEAWFLLARDASGGAAGAAVAIHHRPRRPILSHLLGTLELPAHPVGPAGPDDTAAPLARACEALGRRLGCATLRLDSFGSGRSTFRPSASGYRETSRTEFVIDLTPGLEAAWKGIDKKQRERIRQLERRGIEVEHATSREALGALQTLRRSTQSKRAARGQGYSLAGSERVDAAFHEHLLQPGFARVFVARAAGQPVAGILFAGFGGRAYSIFSGSNEEGYRLGAQSLLYWRAVEAFAGEGYVEVNRGGVPGAAQSPDHPLHGIYSFKLRLGTTPISCLSGFRVLSPVRAGVLHIRDLIRGGSWREAPGDD